MEKLRRQVGVRLKARRGDADRVHLGSQRLQPADVLRDYFAMEFDLLDLPSALTRLGSLISKRNPRVGM